MPKHSDGLWDSLYFFLSGLPEWLLLVTIVLVFILVWRFIDKKYGDKRRNEKYNLVEKYKLENKKLKIGRETKKENSKKGGV